MQPGTPDQEWREDCAPRRVLELFATKWTSMVLHTLHARHGGFARTGVLQRSLPGISQKMLTQTLRDMEASGLLTGMSGTPHHRWFEYRLTDLGQRFVEPVELLYGWGRDNAMRSTSLPRGRARDGSDDRLATARYRRQRGDDGESRKIR